VVVEFDHLTIEVNEMHRLDSLNRDDIDTSVHPVAEILEKH